MNSLIEYNEHIEQQRKQTVRRMVYAIPIALLLLLPLLALGASADIEQPYIPAMSNPIVASEDEAGGRTSLPNIADVAYGESVQGPDGSGAAFPDASGSQSAGIGSGSGTSGAGNSTGSSASDTLQSQSAIAGATSSSSSSGYAGIEPAFLSGAAGKAVVDYSLGPNHALAVTANGWLFGWGNNSSGQAGFSTANSTINVPTRIGTGSNWVRVAAGTDFSLAVRDDGTLWSWGSGANSRRGAATAVSTPTQVGTANTWTEVSAGLDFGLGLRSNGTLWAWGNNVNARTGRGLTTGATTVPTQVGTATNWAQIAANRDSALGIRTNGTLWSWGNNTNGATAQGTTSGNTITPTQVGTGTDWLRVAASHNFAGSSGGRSALGIRGSAGSIAGTLYAWGRDGYGTLGFGNSSASNFSTPTRTGGAATINSVRSIATGQNFSAHVRTNGFLWVAGNGGSNRLGINSTSTVRSWFTSSPVNFVEVRAGEMFGIAQTGAGRLYSWGASGSNQQGRGATGAGTVPTRISALTSVASPPNGAINQGTNLSSIVINFDRPIGTTAPGAFINLTPAAGTTIQLPVPITAGWNATRTQVSVPIPAGTLLPGTQYTVNVPSTVSAWFAGATTTTFTTMTCALVVGVQPSGTNVDVNTPQIQITFLEPILTTPANRGTVTLNGLTLVTPATPLANVIWSSGPNGTNTVLTLPLPAGMTPLAPGTTHTVVIDGWQRSAGAVGAGMQLGPHNHIFVTAAVSYLEIVSVEPVGVMVPVNEPYITITFNEAVDPTAGTRIVTINNDATLNMAGAVWSSGNTVLRIPLSDLQHATTYEVSISGFVSAAGGAMEYAYDHSFRTIIPDLEMTKIVQSPVGTTLPDYLEFEFNFVPVQIPLDAYGTLFSRPVATVPVIDDVRITVETNASALVTTGAIQQGIGTLCLWDLFYNVDFPDPPTGMFVWNVYEVPNSSGSSWPLSVSYDTARFQIRATIDIYGYFYNLIVFEIDPNYTLPWAPPEDWVVGYKVDDIDDFVFVNTVTSYLPDWFEISKTVEGMVAPPDAVFEFTMTITPPSLHPNNHPLEALVFDSYDNMIRYYLCDCDTMYGDPPNDVHTIVFTLRDGERLRISPSHLLAGTIVTVSEAAVLDFAPSAVVTVGGTAQAPISAGFNSVLSTGDFTLSNAGTNSVAFTNTHQFIPLVGLWMSGGQVWIITTVAVIGTALVMVRRWRKHLEETPLW